MVRKDRDAVALKDIGGELCFPMVADVTDNNVQATIIESLKSRSGIDVLVNNAGTESNGILLSDTSPHDVLSLVDVHCLGVLRVSQAVIPLMEKDGIVINVSSRFGSIAKTAAGELDAIECSYAYRIAKAAQNMLTQCMCREFRKTGIRICAIHPGRLKIETASSDADKTPEEAAEELFDKLSAIEHGKFYDLFGGQMAW